MRAGLVGSVPRTWRGQCAAPASADVVITVERSDERLDHAVLRLVERLGSKPLLVDGCDEQRGTADKPECRQLPELRHQLLDKLEQPYGRLIMHDGSESGFEQRGNVLLASPSLEHERDERQLFEHPEFHDRDVAVASADVVITIEWSDERLDHTVLRLVERLGSKPLLVDGCNEQRGSTDKPERHQLPELRHQLLDNLEQPYGRLVMHDGSESGFE